MLLSQQLTILARGFTSAYDSQFFDIRPTGNISQHRLLHVSSIKTHYCSCCCILWGKLCSKKRCSVNRTWQLAEVASFHRHTTDTLCHQHRSTRPHRRPHQLQSLVTSETGVGPSQWCAPERWRAVGSECRRSRTSCHGRPTYNRPIKSILSINQSINQSIKSDDSRSPKSLTRRDVSGVRKLPKVLAPVASEGIWKWGG